MQYVLKTYFNTKAFTPNGMQYFFCNLLLIKQGKVKHFNVALYERYEHNLIESK